MEDDVKLKDMLCPKCNSTDRIFEFYPRLEFNTVTGFNPETGATDGEYVDIYDPADDDPECLKIFRGFELFAHLPKEYDLAKACHVWTMPRSERIDPMYVIAKKLRTAFKLDENAALEIASAHFRPGMSVQDVYVAYAESRKAQDSVESFADLIERYHPLMRKEVALAAAAQAFERHGASWASSFLNGEGAMRAVLEYLEAT